MAVDELNQSRDEVLSDIGITRDELMFASRLRGRSAASEAYGSAEPSPDMAFEMTRLKLAAVPLRPVGHDQ